MNCKKRKKNRYFRFLFGDVKGGWGKDTSGMCAIPTYFFRLLDSRLYSETFFSLSGRYISDGVLFRKLGDFSGYGP